MPEFGPESRIIDVVKGRPDGRDLLYRHGLNLGEGFVDLASQFMTLHEAFREGRIRDLRGLLNDLNAAVH